MAYIFSDLNALIAQFDKQAQDEYALASQLIALPVTNGKVRWRGENISLRKRDDLRREYNMRGNIWANAADMARGVGIKKPSEIRAYYKIAVAADGNWQATCPDCGEVHTATHPSVSQSGVIAAVERHREEAHGKAGAN